MKKIILAIVTIVALASAEWNVKSIVDEWSGDTTYSIETVAQNGNETLLFFDGHIGIFTKYNLTKDFTKSITVKSVDVKCSDGTTYTTIAGSKPSYGEAALVFITDSEIKNIVESMKKCDWVKFRFTDSDESYHVVTIDCNGFTNAYSKLK